MAFVVACGAPLASAGRDAALSRVPAAALISSFDLSGRTAERAPPHPRGVAGSRVPFFSFAPNTSLLRRGLRAERQLQGARSFQRASFFAAPRCDVEPQRDVKPEIALKLSEKLTRLAHQLREGLQKEEEKSMQTEVWVGNVSPAVAYAHNPMEDTPDKHILEVAGALEAMAAALYSAAREGGRLPPLEEAPEAAPPLPSAQGAEGREEGGACGESTSVFGGVEFENVDERLLEVAEMVGGADEEEWLPEYSDYGFRTPLHDPAFGISADDVAHGRVGPLPDDAGPPSEGQAGDDHEA